MMRKPCLLRMMLLLALPASGILTACQKTKTTSPPLNDQQAEHRETMADAEQSPAGLDDLDLGQDWAAAADRRGRGTSNSARLPRQTGSTPTSDDAVTPTSVWVVVLGTFSGDNHKNAARNMSREVRTIDPSLMDAWVHSTKRGSIVALGRFDRPDDPEARETLKRIKSIDIGGRPVFARAMLSRVTTGNANRRVQPHSLMAARQRYPNVDPLYSIDVALWMTDDAGQVSLKDIRRKAEAYAQQLRTQGFDAYFHHDDDKRMSTVTVGLFDHRAVDPQSGLVSSDVRVLMDRFPARLINGEVLNVPIDPNRPSIGAEPQKPFMVLVPRN